MLVQQKYKTENYFWQLLHSYSHSALSEAAFATLVRPPPSFIHLWLSIQSSDGCYPNKLPKSAFYQLVEKAVFYWFILFKKKVLLWRKLHFSIGCSLTAKSAKENGITILVTGAPKTEVVFRKKCTFSFRNFYVDQKFLACILLAYSAPTHQVT